MKSSRMQPAVLASVPRKSRILIVEDHPLVRSAFALLISVESDLQICGETESAGEAIRLCREQPPDLVLIDLMLRTGSGLELCKQLSAMLPDLRMLVISAYDEALYAERVLRAGAKGFVSKNAAQETIFEAIRTVLEGRVWLSAAMESRMLTRVPQGDSLTQSPTERLSDRELQAFELIGRGLTTHQIAARLHLSPKTVESYRENLKRKLGLRSSTELTRHAVQWTMEGP